MGVATGHLTVDENAEHKPDMVLETLEELRIPESWADVACRVPTCNPTCGLMGNDVGLGGIMRDVLGRNHCLMLVEGRFRAH